MIPLTRYSHILAIVALAALLFILPAAAADHTVGPAGSEFSTIKDAVDWAVGGDTIRVMSGTYTDSIRIDKKLTLIGVDTGGRCLPAACRHHQDRCNDHG